MRTYHKMLSYGRKLLIAHHAWIIVWLNRATLIIHVVTLAFNALDVRSRYEIALKRIYFNSFTICSFGGSHCGIKIAGACRTSDAYKDWVDVLFSVSLTLIAHFIDNGPRQIFRNLSSCISWSRFCDWHFLLVTFWWTVFIRNLMLILALFRYNWMMWLILIDLLFWFNLESDTGLRYLLFRNTSGDYGGNVIILFLFRQKKSLCGLMILSVILLYLLKFGHLRF